MSPPYLYGEDFAYYGNKVKAAFVFLGTGDVTKGSTVALHSPQFILDEDVLHRGAAYHVALAENFLIENQNSQKKDEL